MSRFEIYAAILIVFLITLGGAYYKGRLDEARTVHNTQNAADAAALANALKQAQVLIAGDESAQDAAQANLAALNKGIDNAVLKLGKLPAVVVDARGCERISSDWGLRWNTVSNLSGGSSVSSPDTPAGPVQTSPVPPAH